VALWCFFLFFCDQDPDFRGLPSLADEALTAGSVRRTGTRRSFTSETFGGSYHAGRAPPAPIATLRDLTVHPNFLDGAVWRAHSSARDFSSGGNFRAIQPGTTSCLQKKGRAPRWSKTAVVIRAPPPPRPPTVPLPARISETSFAGLTLAIRGPLSRWDS